MPHLIRSPEDIFRTEKRDVYCIFFNEETPEAIKVTWKEMENWFAKNLPNSPTETLAPSEHSGWIMGGPLSLRVAFTDADLKTFTEQWETPDGKSIDPRFQCYLNPYQDWYDKYGCIAPTFEQPAAPGVAVWIETPMGILSHVFADEMADVHPAKAKDLWCNACLLWPQLQAYELDDLCFGYVYKRRAKFAGQWMLLWNQSYRPGESFDGKDWTPILEWLRLPLNTETGSEW
jgi:hypothetical protein